MFTLEVSNPLVPLREQGCTVTVPDLYQGHTFESIEEGVEFRDKIGMGELASRAEEAVSGLPRSVVYAGFSMGAAPATLFAGRRPGARGLILIHGALSPDQVGLGGWPGVPAQVHYSQGDPWIDVDAVERFRAYVETSGAMVESFVYHETEHLFTDSGTSEYSEPATQILTQRVIDFLQRLPAGTDT